MTTPPWSLARTPVLPTGLHSLLARQPQRPSRGVRSPLGSDGAAHDMANRRSKRRDHPGVSLVYRRHSRGEGHLINNVDGCVGHRPGNFDRPPGHLISAVRDEAGGRLPDDSADSRGGTVYLGVVVVLSFGGVSKIAGLDFGCVLIGLAVVGWAS